MNLKAHQTKVGCSPRVASLFLTLLVCTYPSVAQQPPVTADAHEPYLIEGAFDIERSAGNCQYLSYKTSEPYPATKFLKQVSGDLRTRAWTRLRLDMFNEADVPVPDRWRGWTNVAGGRVHTLEQQWQSREGDVVYYKLWYFDPNRETLKVDARYCTAYQLERTAHHADCKAWRPDSANESDYSASVYITRIDPAQDGYKVWFRVENNGAKPILITTEGKLDDGLPALWASVVQEQDGSWGYVGNECPEHTPLTWTILEPDEHVESWTRAVDFSEPNHRFRMCTRHIGHLQQSPLRISIRYFTSICDIQNSFEAKEPYFADSEAVAIPIS